MNSSSEQHEISENFTHKLSTFNRQELLAKVASFPTKPGVYLHKNSEGRIIYVGKAKNLRSRVRSYFDEQRQVDAKTKVLMSKISDIEVLVTDTEAEALLLENNLIKQHKPKYNILLKDDKTYPYIRVTNEQFPRVFFTRTIIRDGSKYYGPYTDGRYLSSLLQTLRSLFPLRSCQLPLTEDTIANGKYKVCLDYHIKKCEGMCEGHVTRLHYSEHIKQVHHILSGKSKEVEHQLELQMENLANEFQFESAAEVRDRLSKLRDYVGKQKVLTTELIDRDVFAFSRDDHQACVIVLTIRDGKLIGKRHYYLSNVLHHSDSELIERAIERWYSENDMIPDEIFLPVELESIDFHQQWLDKKRGSHVELSIPKIGDKRKLVNMATANAEFMLRELHLEQSKKNDAVPRTLASIQRDLRLTKTPRRIECFDNSHLQGTDYVSSMVVFVDGRPKKSEYRKYKIKTFTGNDDFLAMQEVVTRRYSRAIEEKLELPDLIIIDGGKGQLSHAVEILKGLGLYPTIQVIGLAKRLEEVFFPNESDSLLLPRTSSSLRLLQQLRDEAHRFAITFHRELRSKRTLQTELTEIDGIGEKTAQKLLQELGSVSAIKRATLAELELIVSKSSAMKIKEYFSNQNEKGT